MSDLQALARLDEGAWRALFEDNYDRLMRYAYLRTCDVATARDVAERAFAAAIAHAGDLRGHARSPVALLLECAARELDARHAHHVAGAPVPPEMRVLADTLARARSDVRDVLLLRLIERRSIAETSALLNLRPDDVRSAQRRALRALGDRRARDR